MALIQKRLRTHSESQRKVYMAWWSTRTPPVAQALTWL